MTLDSVTTKIQAALQRDPLTAQDTAEAQVWATLATAVVLQDLQAVMLALRGDVRDLRGDIKRRVDALEVRAVGAFSTPDLGARVQQ